MSELYVSSVCVLTRDMIQKATRKQELRDVVNLNFWGCGLEDVSIFEHLYNVSVLSLSVNKISTLKHFQRCFNLQELYLRKNKIEYLYEIRYLRNLPNLKVLWLSDNQCASSKSYRRLVIRTLPQLQILDNIPISAEERKEAIDDISPSTRNFLESLNVEANKLNIPADYFSRENVATLRNLEARIFPIAYNDGQPSEDELVTSMSSPDSDESHRRNRNRYANVVPYTRPEIMNRAEHMNRKSHNCSILSAVLMLVEELDLDGLSHVKDRCRDLISAKLGGAVIE